MALEKLGSALTRADTCTHCTVSKPKAAQNLRVVHFTQTTQIS